MSAPATASDRDARRPAEAAPVCRCRDLAVDLDGHQGPARVLDGISVDLRAGEIVSVMGRSGSGKTTLLRVLAGLVEPAAGSEVTYQGRPLAGPPEGVAFVFQDYAGSLLPWRTVERNVGLGLEGRVPRGERRRRLADALAMVGLADRARDHPWQLSGGMQQRVQLARALAMDARLLLMDEPFGALDALTRASLQDELQRVHAERRPTVAFVTHDVDEAAYLSDRVLVLRGSPATVVADVAVGLPRPRHQLATREHPEFLRLRRALLEHIGDGRG